MAESGPESIALRVETFDEDLYDVILGRMTEFGRALASEYPTVYFELLDGYGRVSLG